jgi:hypothetical protein
MSDLPRGECVLTRLPDGRLRIDHADPRVLISAELIRTFEDGTDLISMALPPGVVTLFVSAPALRLRVSGEGSHCGALLKIVGVNRQVVYRITGYVAAIDAYVGEWPE